MPTTYCWREGISAVARNNSANILDITGYTDSLLSLEFKHEKTGVSLLRCLIRKTLNGPPSVGVHMALDVNEARSMGK